MTKPENSVPTLDLSPCPFCKSEHLHLDHYYEGYTDEAVVECLDCLGSAPLETWLKLCRWQPIETAPRDGLSILVFSEFGAHEAYWDGYSWLPTVQSDSEECTLLRCKPIFWMPLPAPPEEGE